MWSITTASDGQGGHGHRLKIQMGELSAARYALEGDPIAPGSDATLNALEDPERRPRQPRELLADDLFAQRGPTFSFDPDLFAKNVRNARRGAVGGPSGMAADHLRMLLECEADIAKFWRLAQDLARAAVPKEILDVIRLGRLTALAKPSGGIRGIVCGDIVVSWQDDGPTVGWLLVLNGQLLHFSTPSLLGLEESASPTHFGRLLTLTTAPPSCQSTGSVFSTLYPERPC